MTLANRNKCDEALRDHKQREKEERAAQEAEQQAEAVRFSASVHDT